MTNRLLVHIAVERQDSPEPRVLESACVVSLNATLQAITDPNPTTWLGGGFVTKKEDWPALQRWLQEEDRPSRIILTIRDGTEELPAFEGSATLRQYRIDEWERPDRPDLIAGTLFMHIISSRPADLGLS